MRIFLVTVAIILFCILALGSNVFFRKDGEFPKYDVGSNEEMKKLGIRCFKDEDAALHGEPCEGDGRDACKDCNLLKKS